MIASMTRVNAARSSSGSSLGVRSDLPGTGRDPCPAERTLDIRRGAFACALLYSPQLETIDSGAHAGQVAAPNGRPLTNSATLSGPSSRELS